MDRIQERITAVLRVPHTTDPHVARHAEHLREAADTARDAFGALCKALNGGPREAVVGGLLAGLTTEHRYLVNDAVWALLDALGEWGGGSPRSYTDARNESAHLACREVREALKDRIYWREAK